MDSSEQVKRPRLWRGFAEQLDRRARIVVAVALGVSIFALSLTNLGMYQFVGADGATFAFARFLLAPVALAALLYGAVGGVAAGALAGLVALAHAQLIPAGYYELYFVDPVNTVAVFVLAGLAFGLCFAAVYRSLEGGAPRGKANNPGTPRGKANDPGTPLGASVAPDGADARMGAPTRNGANRHVRNQSTAGARIVRIAAITVVSAIVSSACYMLFCAAIVVQFGGLGELRQLGSFVGSDTAFALIAEAAVVALCCCIADAIVLSLRSSASERSLASMFRWWMSLVVFIVFMVIATAQFMGVSLGERNAAKENIESEINYLSRQLVDHAVPVDGVLDGYDVQFDGAVHIVSDGRVVATNDPSVEVGSGDNELFGMDSADEEIAGTGQILLDLLSTAGDLEEWELPVEGGHTELCSVRAVRAGDFYIMIAWPVSKVYAERPATMGWTALATLVQLAAVFLLATMLLNRVVVRRIDETNETLGLITEGDLNKRVNVRDSREFTSLSNGINSTVSALRDSIAEVEQRNARELLTAKAIQESALPREFPPYPEIDRFDIYASMKTAKEVGGDFYDFFLIDERRLGFVMADVSGKGIPAALFMMTAKTQIENYMMAGLPVGQAIDAANHQLCIGNDAGMFVTAYACVLDYETGELSYVNAGHNPPLLQHDGAWEWMRDVSGMPLGLFDGIPYEQFTRQLAREDVLYLYTDGVTEAMNLDGELFGEDRLEDTLRTYAQMNPRSIGVGVRRAITDFTLDCEQSDDITMLCLKYGVPPERRAIMILRAETAQLVHVFNFIHEELKRRSAPKSVYNPLDIAAEELFVNVCHYAYPDATPEEPGEVRIGFEYSDNPPALTVSIADDGIPYNPLEKPDAVTPDDVMEVPIGGLGILMAKKSVDSMEYRREDGSNILTFKKSW